MEIDECIKNRRSIRSYLDKELSYEEVLEIIDAARYAPSSGNIQNWRFIVIKDKDVKTKIAMSCLKQYWMIDAPIQIIVCSKIETIKRLYGDKGEFLYTTQNCAAAIENMLLKAYSLGVGTCWVGAFEENMIKKALRIPEDIRVEAVITLGYPKEEVEVPARKTIDTLLFFNEWDNKKRQGLFPLERSNNSLLEKVKDRLKFK